MWTHARTHTYTVLTAAREPTFPNTQPGLSRAIAWAGRRTGGNLATLWVIESTGSYGALFAGMVQRSGYNVIEAPNVIGYTRSRTGAGKSDPIDARAIATGAVLLEFTQQRFPWLDAGTPVIFESGETSECFGRLVGYPPVSVQCAN